MNEDIHDTPSTWSDERVHLLDGLDCWCKPDWKARIGGPGRIVIHHDETTVRCPGRSEYAA